MVLSFVFFSLPPLPGYFSADALDFDVKGTSCNASVFKNPILVGCSALMQCNNKSRIACK